MHPALWQLMWLDARGSLRRLVRGKRTWQQIGLALLLLLFIALIIGSQLVSVAAARSAGQELQSTRFGAAMPFWALLYLLVTWLTAAADRGLVMRPAEVQFLIGGPFPARDIITLNLIRLAYRALVSAVILAGVGWAYMPNFASGLVGLWMLFTFSLLVGMLASLSARRALPSVVKRGRKLLSAIALVVLITMVGEAIRAVGNEQEPITFARVAAAASETRFGQWLLPPVGWLFAPLRSATFWPDVPIELLIRAPIFLLVIVAIYAVGGSFGEAATERTDQALARRQASMRSGASGAGTALKQLRLPMLPRLGGIGSIAWLEMLQALRMLPRFLLYTGAIVGIVLVAPLVVNRNRLEGLAGLGWMAGLTGYADFLMLLQLPVGFLGPMSQRETFKLLPMSSLKIVVGILAGPLLPLAINHVLITAMFVYLVPDQIQNVLWTAVALIPLACVLAATINLLGLWNIIKPRALQQRDALAAGRAMLSVWIFSVMLIPTIALGAGGAAISGVLLGGDYLSYLFGGACGVAISCMGFVMLLAWFFHRWQPQAGSAGEEEQEFDR